MTSISFFYILCRLYSMFVMVGCMRDELQAMRSGLTDVIPPELLEGLTAEVYIILLCTCM